MNQLTATQEQAFTKLPLNLREFASARVEKPIKSYNDFELKTICLDIITISYKENNQWDISAEMLAHQRNALLDELRTSNKFKELTVSEVRKAFKMGIRGESGAFFGLCEKTYHQFLKHYYEKPERVEAFKKYLEIANEEIKHKMTPEELDKKNWDACVWYFNEYKKTGELPTGHYTFYGILMNEGLIKWTPEEKMVISTPIKEHYKKEIESDYKKRRITKLNYTDIMISLDSNPTLIDRVRKVALKKYFDGLIKNNIETLVKT